MDWAGQHGMTFRRYAIYFTPPPGAFADFGTAWLGWDPVRGRPCDQPTIDSLPLPISEITAAPRPYGFHATMAAPFKLMDELDAQELASEFRLFCKQSVAVSLTGLQLTQFGRFLALAPAADTPGLNDLATRVIRSFDRFRLPLTAAELARRRKGNLKPQQDALLLKWGYPYVMEEFRFHMTLTGKLKKPYISEVHSILSHQIEPFLNTPFVIDGLSLMGEDSEGMFHQIERHKLSG